MSTSIRIITSIIILLMIGLFIASFFDYGFLIPSSLLFIICFFCWIYSPSSYEIEGNDLIVNFNCGKKVFKSIKSVSTVDKEISGFGLRLFGNGGVFSGTGIFWNRKLGVFRVYVTSARKKEMLLLETDKDKVIISPLKQEKFLTRE